MKLCAVVILFLLTSIAIAQPPRIDSMSIDESKRLLSVYGDFGFSKGKVFCDSVELQIISWSDTLVVSAIKDTGRGHAGPVTIGARGYLSNMRLLTQVLFAVAICDTHASPDHCDNLWYKMDKTNRSIYWRYDFHSFFINNKNAKQLQFSRGGSTIIYDFPSSSTSIGFITVAGYYRFAFNWDALSGGGETAPISSNPWLKEAYDGIELFTPSHEAFALYRPLSLFTPKNNTFSLPQDSLVFLWDSLKYLGDTSFSTRYHFELSTDTLFSKLVIDTIIPTQTFASNLIKGGTNYFWRVAGVNSEGEVDGPKSGSSQLVLKQLFQTSRIQVLLYQFIQTQLKIFSMLVIHWRGLSRLALCYMI
jgi:hypothetical protein